MGAHTSHAHDDAAHGADHAEGGQVPEAPATRRITPAWSDFESMPAPRALLWPLFWVALAAAVWSLLQV